MGGFATNNVNMIKLESYNYGADFVITQFYCEIEGHPGQENTKFALDDMHFLLIRSGSKESSRNIKYRVV